MIPFLFPNPRKGRFQGQRLRDFGKAWKPACRKVGLTSMIRHDFRRSAVRNLIQSGVPETVKMKISGHKTRSVFDRYNTTSRAMPTTGRPPTSFTGIIRAQGPQSPLPIHP